MSRKVAILGLGETGARWSRLFHKAGWTVAAFDPDPNTFDGASLKSGWRRYDRISTAVQGADWVMLCLPERLDLIRMVIRRAQSEAPRDAAIVSTARSFDVDEVQSCASRPAQVVKIGDGSDGGFSLDLTSRNSEDLRKKVASVLPELAAIASLEPDGTKRKPDQSDDAISA